MTLRHVQTVRKGSAVYRYLRLPGQPRIKLPDLPPDHPDFLIAYAQALQTAPKKIRAATGSVKALVEAYLRSDLYLSLSSGYRAILRRHADAIVVQAEDAKAVHLRSDHIQDDLAPLIPNVAAQRLKAWRAVCAFGMETGLLKSDPSKAVIKKKIPETDGHPAWTAGEVAKFREAYPIGTATRAIFEVLHWTGCRISDAVKIGPGMVGGDGVLAYRQIKTGDLAFVPWTCHLKPFAAAGQGDRDMMHAAIAAVSDGRRHMTFLATQQGKTRSHKAAGHVIANAAGRLGIDKSAHGLRKFRAATLAEGGASILEIGAWTGHQTLAEIAHYTESADRRRAVAGTEQVQNSVNSPDPSCKLAIK